MWFGDLVTMQWWDDLWLNESFAEYMAHRTCVAATEFTDAWVDSTIARKAVGLCRGAHPLDPPGRRVACAGRRSGPAGLRRHLLRQGRRVAAPARSPTSVTTPSSPASTAYLRSARATATARWPSSWAPWSRRSGQSLDDVERGLAADRRRGRDLGRPRRHRDPHGAAGSYPADRPHTLDVAGFTDGAEVFRVPVTVTQDRTVVEALRDGAGRRPRRAQRRDLTWATVALDAGVGGRAADRAWPPCPTRRPAPSSGSPWSTASASARSTRGCWSGPSVRPGRSRTTTRCSTARPLALLGRIIPTFLPPAEHEWAEQVVAGAAEQVLAAAEPGSTRALVAARTVARSSADESLLRAWAAAKDRPAGLEDDSDFGWIAVRNLAARGLVDQDFVEGRRADDDTLQGRLNSLLARAAMPAADAKAWAWDEITANRSRSNYELNALAQGFWLADDLDVVRPYVERYFADVPAMTRVGRRGRPRPGRQLAYPRRVVEDATVERSAAALACAGLSAAVRRSMVDAESELREALRSRATFG